MSTLLHGRVMIYFAALAFVSSLAQAAGNSPAQSRSSAAPQDEPRFKVGNTLVVASEGASLMVGDAIVATAPKGQRIVIVEVREGWIGTYVAVDGQNKSGWIETAHFVPATNVAQSETPIFRPSALVVSEPEPKTVRVVVPAVSYNSRTDYFSDYDTGYYTRHETDPNVHVWEPWRH